MPLTIIVPEREFWNETINEFVSTKGGKFTIEHSLLSISKWEAKWHKPFINNNSKTEEEIQDYIRMATLTQNVDPDLYRYLTAENYKEIGDYLNDPMTATTVNDTSQKRGNKEIVTSELIYYWMVAYQIPFECEKWHINRLLMLIRVCGAKNSGGGKKMSQKEILARNKALNDARKKQLHTKG